MLGYDVEIATNFADQLGVDVQFDRDSKSFNDLVRRAGAGDFDFGNGKLGTACKRMSDAILTNMEFQTCITCSRRKSIASVKVKKQICKSFMTLKLKIGFIKIRLRYIC